MKEFLKSLLRRLHAYDHFKYSKLFQLYELFFKPEVKVSFQKEYNFYSSFLDPCDLIFDIGANDGHKTEVFLGFAGRVVCCEPDERNFRVLTTRFRNRRKRVVLENMAIASEAGIRQMFVHHEGSAFNTLNPKFKAVTEADQLEKWNEEIYYTEIIPVPVTTLSELILRHGKPYFIKIDVEGYELEVIRGLQTPVPYLSLECLFPDFKSELMESLVLLQQLDPGVQFNIAEEERLQFDAFVDYKQLQQYLQAYPGNHFELIVKMEA